MFQLPSLIGLYSSIRRAPNIDARYAPPPHDSTSEFIYETIARILGKHGGDAKHLCTKFRRWGEMHETEDEFWRLAFHHCFGIKSSYGQRPAGVYQSWRHAFDDVCLSLDALNDENLYLVDTARQLHPAQLNRVGQRFRDATRPDERGLVWLFAALGSDLDDKTDWTKLDEKLRQAVSDNKAAEVCNLLRDGADPNLRIGESGITPLMQSVYREHTEVARALLRDPMTYIDAENNRGETAKQLARTMQRAEIISMIEDEEARRKHAARVRRNNFRSEALREK